MCFVNYLPRDRRAMIDAEWDNTKNPEAMLQVVRQLKPGKSKYGRRKLRLFACACCRNWWDDFSTNSREALEITERYADGQATRREFGRAQRISEYDFRDVQEQSTFETAVNRSTVNGATNWLTSSAEIAGFCIPQHLRAVARQHSVHMLDQETERQVTLLREVFGDPNRPPSIERKWLEWNDGAIPRLADEIYRNPQPGDYLRLRQYLSSSGCDDSIVLDHCSSRHPHIVGCWLLDVLRGVHWPKPRLKTAR